MEVLGRGRGLFRYNHDRERESLLLGVDIFVMTLCGCKILVALASLGWTKRLTEGCQYFNTCTNFTYNYCKLCASEKETYSSQYYSIR